MHVLNKPEHDFAVLQFVAVMLDPDEAFRNGRLVPSLRWMQPKLHV
jgi:hypothetical protein